MSLQNISSLARVSTQDHSGRSSSLPHTHKDAALVPFPTAVGLDGGNLRKGSCFDSQSMVVEDHGGH